MFGLSPLSTGHPPSFQPRWVRPSTGSYPRFSLPMDRSPGFASAARDWSPCSGSLSLRLAPCFALPRTATRWLILQKARRDAHMGAPAACRRTVSGAVSLPSRGAFHLSLTVLVRYRSQESVQAWRVVPPASHRVSRVRRYSGACLDGSGICVRGSSPVPPAFPCRSASLPHPLWQALQPPGRLRGPGFGLVPVRSPLLGESRLISLPPGT